MGKAYGFKWRKNQTNSSPSRKGETAPARTPEVKIPPPAPAKEAQAAATPAAQPPSPSHERIAIRAYALWETQGWPDGAHLENWLEAEHELRSEAR